MTRQEIIEALKKYFRLEELVCPHTFQKFGNTSWQFLDTEILHTLLVLRTEILTCPLIINDYVFGGRSSQRGLRCNICELSKSKTIKNQLYLSAHCNGAGLDIVFNPKGMMTAQEARKQVKLQKDKLPYNVRIEKDVTWLHIDCYDTGTKVGEFKG